MRSDLSPSAYGSCEVEELRGSIPHGHDVLMVVRRRMADGTPSSIKCVMSAQRAASLRLSFEQPGGLALRRPIGDQVKKNISVYAPRCKDQGVLTEDGSYYLESWAQAQWPSRPRPRSYSILNHRQPLVDPVRPVGPSVWEKPRRSTTWDLRPRADDSETASEDDEAPINMV